ncbi:MAG: 30S ribosomal protein S21 [Candidatus Pacebacteria bacterium]|nr:30S ribosomal protein S21 [Candidatus Paceibacterota bacterium]
MSINAEVTKVGNESAIAVIRKFSRRVQGTGLIKNSRKTRYYERNASKSVQKKRALKLIKRKADFKQLIKEGKVAETPTRRGYNRDANQSQAQANKAAENTNSGPARFGENTPIAR